jgi:microsomal dipeptidase-like Zn-dependent dipeptidase
MAPTPDLPIRPLVLAVLVIACLAAPAAARAAGPPEPGTGASGRAFSGTAKDGSVLGFADDHVHITANLRAGGRVISGKPFDPRGVAAALGDDARDHGADGSGDVVGNLLRGESPTAPHDTGGWPTFAGWPTHDTLTHQQTYWVWLKRAWQAGLRLVVAQTVEDDELCRVQKRRSHSCSEPVAIAQQVRVLRGLQRYVDARSGGRGHGFFCLVYGPRQARRVIERGKLAVVIGVESSNPFGCRLKAGRATCDARDVDRGLTAYHRLGIRTLFIAHWFDNAFAGAALEGGLKGAFINAMNRLETGHYLRVAACPLPGQGEQTVAAPKAAIDLLAPFFNGVSALSDVPVPAYPAGNRCNARGLTRLGAHLVRRMMRMHMIIEADHMSEPARDRVLKLTAARHYPVLSGHNGTGGAWTARELRQLYRSGGVAASTLDTAPQLIRSIDALGRFGHGRKDFGVPLGSDVGGFASLPGPSTSGGPLEYPFKSFLGDVTFRRQRTGTRTFDLNADGVAHYGLVADLLADVQRRPGGRHALGLLFHGAESYLRMWQRTGAR